MKKFALVLGGGASKGYAHIGVLKILEENNILPDLIVGTSIGAVVGGVYASDKTADELVQISKNLTRKKIMDFSPSQALFKGSAMKGNKLRKLLQKYVGDVEHKQLKIPFVAVATDLEQGEQVLLYTGNVVDSIMASSAIPSVFPPVEINNHLLFDGGLVNNVPDDAVKQFGDFVILSIDVIGEYDKQIEDSRFKLMSRMINSLTLMQTQITKHKGISSDLRITISQPDVLQMKFSKEACEKSIIYGKQAMQKNIAKLKKLLKD